MRFTAPTPSLARPIRVCSIQYALRRVANLDAFAEQVECFVDVGDDYDADLILFPELLTVQLMSCLPRNIAPSEAMREIAARYTTAYDEMFRRLSDGYNRIIVAGTHPRMVDGQLMNVAGIFIPGHAPVFQPKLHITPTERNVWHFSPGHELTVVETDFGRFAASVCYDVQFPEIARVLCEHGVQLLLVPYLTDDRRGHHRVTTCAKARAVENQIYVATAGMVGSLPLVTDLTAQYAQSGIYTPADFAFPFDNIATEAAPNTEMVSVADLDLAILDRVRTSGSVLNYKDAAEDGLHVTFDGPLHVHHLPWSSLPGEGHAGFKAR